MSPKHQWTEEDDIIALYMYKFNGEEEIPYSYEHIATIRGFSTKSLECAILNFKAIDTEKGLKNFAKHQMDTYKRHNNKSKEALKALVLKILSKEP